MLADPKARALTDNFAGQWLYLRNLRGIQPNSDLFPDFDDNLREAMRTEAELFFASVVAEDRSVLDLLTADDTFVNERLARHYGVAGVTGARFQRVQVPDARRGLLGKGAILLATSHATTTSPVLRGKWILDNILGVAAAGAAARRAGAGRERPGGAPHDARAAGAPPRQPDVRRLPQADGSDRLRAREFRRRRRLARRQRVGRAARHAPTCWPTAPRSTAWTACARRWPRARTSSCARSSRS